ncbi:nuclear transport factor 2 family protein [Salmonirosea aquatica]|uniref:DUF4440 domain-containing protein n=1 Tax=Salmonirosea aquatica TaxID=2654236 RepID=A0A7C9BGU8_9BACT|nr:DUF4440 domain-containing protein [Cytophagaceae bacterium SJW1-29]
MKSSLSPKVLLLAFVVFLGARVQLYAQSEPMEVKAAVDRLFTGMRTGDSSLVSQSFTADATLQSVSLTADGQIKIGKNAITGFVRAVGTPHKDVWDERIYDLKIQVDGPMATVWAPYKFYLGDKFSHCGVNAFTLIKTQHGWKIASITDTRRKEECL